MPSGRYRTRSPVRYSRAPRVGGERIGDEALGGELGPVPVAARDAVAADVQLAGDADRHRLPVPVEHVEPQCWRSAGRSGTRARVRRDRGDRGARWRTSWSRSARTRSASRAGGPARRHSRTAARIDRLAAEQHVLHAGEGRRPRCARSALNSAVVRNSAVTPSRRSRVGEPRRIAARPRAASTTSRAPLSSAPQISNVAASNDGLDSCATRSSGAELRRSRCRRPGGRRRGADHHALGLAGRARRVDHVGERVGRGGRRRIARRRARRSSAASRSRHDARDRRTPAACRRARVCVSSTRDAPCPRSMKASRSARIVGSSGT